jgi:hypothetical protein
MTAKEKWRLAGTLEYVRYFEDALFTASIKLNRVFDDLEDASSEASVHYSDTLISIESKVLRSLTEVNELIDNIKVKIGRKS